MIVEVEYDTEALLTDDDWHGVRSVRIYMPIVGEWAECFAPRGFTPHSEYRLTKGYEFDRGMIAKPKGVGKLYSRDR